MLSLTSKIFGLISRMMLLLFLWGSYDPYSIFSVFNSLLQFIPATSFHPSLSSVHLSSALFSHKVVEVSASSESVQSPALNPRKRLHSAEEVQCGSRPNPEGAGSMSMTELSYSENKHGRESLCQRCQIIANQLNRQACELAKPGTLKVCAFN